LDLATKQNARIIFGGDTRQHSSVSRGDALRILNTVGGITAAEVNKIHRQKNAAYREAVEYLAKGEVAIAFDKLDAIGFIKEGENPKEVLLKEYLDALKKGKDALVICPTHKEGDTLTAAIRSDLRKAGRIGKKEIIVDRLRNLNLTEAQKADVQNFNEGQIVQFNQHVNRFKRGERWTVDKVDKQEVQITNEAGDVWPLPMYRSGHFDVFVKEELQLSKGDRVRVTKGTADSNNYRMDTGKMLSVVSVAKDGTVVLKNDLSKSTYTIGKDFGHISHAHCITSHASQGKTVDVVFIHQPSVTFPATDAKQFYVSISRAREIARIFTDSKDALLTHARQLRERMSALELTSKIDDAAAGRKRRSRSQTNDKEQSPKHKEHYERDI
jgi:ATP-dependent exoDNAse (exonuclease V) alpha subunit